MLGLLAHAYGRAGRIAEARRTLDELTGHAEARYVSPFHFAVARLGLGETERAVELLERADRERGALVEYIGVDPLFEPLHGHPRFQALLVRMRLAPG